MNQLLVLYRVVRSHSVEIYRRLQHAVSIFKMRFMLLKIPTHLNLPDVFVFDCDKAVNRGREAPDGKFYSLTYQLDWLDIPEVIKQEIRKFDTVLRLYFGGDYLIDTANVWRNIGLPESYRSLDIYSQVWHYDHVVDYRNIQLFVLLTDTTALHGPFEYIENSSEKKLCLDVEKRNGVELVGFKIKKLIGVRGDGMLFSTGAIPHRAGIPVHGNHRDMFSIAFFPKYTGIGVDSELLLGMGA